MPLPAGRHAWLQVLRGSVEFNGVALWPPATARPSARSGSGRFGPQGPSEVLLFDLA